MPDGILVPDGSSSADIEIKKSKFIGMCYTASNEKSARDILLSIRAEHKFARHVVYAFICGKPNSQTMGMSDDGEPKGTAGKPVLQVLKGSGITDILCVVVRYFGGIKLGTGGLVKAYTEAAQAALENLKTKFLVNESVMTVTVIYDCYEQVRRIITAEKGARITGEQFLAEVIIRATIPDAALDEALSEIKGATSGRAVFS